MGSLPLTRSGVGSAVNDTTRQVGGAVGVAVVGSVFSSIYGAKVVSALQGRGIPASLVTEAKQQLGFALEAALHLKHGAAAFVHLAQTAFVQGLHAGLLVAAGTAAVVITASAAAMRESSTSCCAAFSSAVSSRA